jgi:Nif-specific regulatory protein
MCRNTVWLRQEDGELTVVAAIGLSGDEISRGRLKPGEGVTGRICSTGVPAVVPDVSLEPLFLNRTGVRRAVEGQIVSFIGVPIKVGRDCIGVLSVDRKGEKHPLDFQRDVLFLSMVANLIGQTVKLHRAVIDERNQLLSERSHLKRELAGKFSIDNVIGRSKRMQEVFADVHQVAPARSTVLIRGESGTGKEAIARAIHFLGNRKDGPFVKLNCAALPESLLESELFGHEKGSFTGATGERKGRFELANGGTLFLDEIGDISPGFQAKLLRVLQEREFERVGGSKTIKVDVRLVAATNRNLEDMVKKGDFRADLYYRINVVTIFLPPLRDRREDIPALVDYFIGRFNKDNKRKLAISPEAMEIFTRCNWPGNVRELENCIERAATMTRGNVIRNIDMRCQKGQCFASVLSEKAVINVPMRSHPTASKPHEIPAVEKEAEDELPPVESSADEESGNERDRIIRAMEKCGWVQAKAARLLNLTPRQMGYALRKYGIEIKRL